MRQALTPMRLARNAMYNLTTAQRGHAPDRRLPARRVGVGVPHNQVDVFVEHEALLL